jgi:hypothetical protein
LDFFAEAFGAGFTEEFDDVFDGLGCAMAEVDAIVAGEIAAGFAGGDDVVGGDAVLGKRTERDRTLYFNQRGE